MDRKINKIISSKKSASSVDVDSYINLQINTDERLFPPGEINKVVDVNEQFNIERQSCPYYRLFGKISTLTSNPLFNIRGKYPTTPPAYGGGYEAFANTPLTINLDPDADNNRYTFGEALTNRLKKVDGWYGYFEPQLDKAGSCLFYEMTPTRNHFSLIENVQLGLKNWNLTITYPYSSDKTNILINGGVIIVDKEAITIGGKQMTNIGTIIKHNLNVGDTVRILVPNQQPKDYDVKGIGKANGSLGDYYFAIDTDLNSLPVNLSNSSSVTRFTKVYNNVASTYYFRKFKEIKTKLNTKLNGNYDVSNLGFSLSLFNENIIQFNLNEDVDISNLTDNLGRPLSELYLTFLKTDSSGMFSKLSSGIESPFISVLNSFTSNPVVKDLPIIQKIHNVPQASLPAGAGISQSYVPLQTAVSITDNDFYGDVVEYNTTTLQEVVLSDVQYRFNTNDRETTSSITVSGANIPMGPRPEGYYYKGHTLIKIRDFSSYIEEGDANTFGIPSYAENLGDGRIIWRDLLDIGGADITKSVVNYPFLNGYHYIFNNFIFGLKRQDPFDNWDIYYSIFPSDPPGTRKSNKFDVNTANNEC